jgi:hypothetical protein
MMLMAAVTMQLVPVTTETATSPEHDFSGHVRIRVVLRHVPHTVFGGEIVLPDLLCRGSVTGLPLALYWVLPQAAAS